MSEAEIEALRTRWAEIMRALTRFLYEQQYKDAKLTAILTQLELPNLMAMLLWFQDRAMPETVIDLASSIESLTSRLGRKSALTQAVRMREKAALKLGDWSQARYLTESATIDRLLEQGDLPAAHVAAQQLLRRCIEAGEGAYLVADYDLARAYGTLGQVLRIMGAGDDALQSVCEAARRFENLAKSGDKDAERMCLVAMVDIADCLSDLGRLDEAVLIYHETIRQEHKLGNKRGVAKAKGQLGTVLLLQAHYDEALTAYEEALQIFQSFGELSAIAGYSYQIGVVHRQSGRFELAENAYRRSLAIEVKTKNLEGEARSLSELANLYRDWDRIEEAVTFYKQAVDAFNKQQNLISEGQTRSNLALTLIQMQRYDDARREVLRAIECEAPFGHTAHIWKTWGVLYDLEEATGNYPAAEAARQKAIESYLAYRRAGGVSQHQVFDLFAGVANAIHENQAEAATQQLAQISAGDIPQWLRSLIAKLQAILQGDRSPSLADNPSLSFKTVAELQLLLEQNPLPNA